MKRIFIDTDILIDFLTYRKPFAEDAARLFELSKRGKLEIFISSLSVSNIHYIVSRIENSKKAISLLRQLAGLTGILPVDKSMVHKALYSDFKDFEDAIQNFCAEAAEIKTIITRNIKDYSKSNLSILTAKDLLSEF